MTEDLAALFWRCGHKLGRTVYAQHGFLASDADELIGLFDTAELALEAVHAHNSKLIADRYPESDA